MLKRKCICPLTNCEFDAVHFVVKVIIYRGHLEAKAVERENHKLIRCYAEGKGDKWEAFCLDFDLAVQGRSFIDVYNKLNEQIELYVEGVSEAPAEERERLINRSAPFSSWLRVAGLVVASGLLPRRDHDRPERHTYDRRLDDFGGCRAAA